MNSDRDDQPAHEFDSPGDAEAAIIAALERPGSGAAFPIAESACRQFPDSVELSSVLAMQHLGRGDIESAEKECKRALNLDPTNSRAILAQAEFDAFMARIDEATKLLAKSNWEETGDFFVLGAACSVLIAMGDAEKAASAALRAYELFPDSGVAFAQAYNAVLSNEGAAAAKKVLDSASATCRESGHFARMEGRVYRSDRKLEQALECAQRAVAIIPESSDAWADVAMAQFHLGQIDNAERSAKFSIELNSRSVNAMRILANVAEHRHDKRNAAMWRSKASDAVPLLSTLLVSQGVAELIKKGDDSGAIELLNRGLDSPLPFVRRSSRTMLVDTLVRLERWDELEENLDAMNADGQLSAKYWLGKIALAHHRQGPERAIEVYERAVKADSLSGGAVAKRIEIAAEAGDSASIDSLVEFSCGIPFQMPVDYSAIVLSLSKIGRTSDAERLYNSIRNRFGESDKLRNMLLVIKAGKLEDGIPTAADLTEAFRLLDPEQKRKLRKRVRKKMWYKFTVIRLKRLLGIVPKEK